jgi:PAT family beta-lactamase induction signal transducer AmpG
MSSTDATPAPRSYASPFFWVPSSYLAMGLIYVTVSGVANIMFKNMGMTDAEAARWSSLFVFPYVIKPLWAPALEIYKTKRFFVLLMQTLLVGAVLAIALTLKVPGIGWTPILLLLGLAGLLGATQDIASDGVYVTTLGPKEQARYTGVQSMCWNAGPILANGALVWLSGLLFRTFHGGSFSLAALRKFAVQGGGEQVNVGAVSDPLQQAVVRNQWALSWMVIFLITAALMALLLIYHTKLLPTGSKAQDAPESFAAAMRTYGHAFSTFFQKQDIWKMLAFALLFRLGYGFLEKMVPLFMIGSRESGGLGLSNEVLGQINGIFGTGAFMAGSILGGLIVARLGLRKTLVWLCLSMNVPNVVYVYLSMTRDARYPVVATLITIDKLFWGIGAVGLIVYMMQQISPGQFRTAYYTFASAIMGLNMMLTGYVSGSLAEFLGYKAFFWFVLACFVPSLAVTLWAPFHHPDATSDKSDDAVAA